MEQDLKRKMHLTVLAHIWVVMPFVIPWLMIEKSGGDIPESDFGNIVFLLIPVVAYLAIRTWFALKGERDTKWEYIYPPIDILIISLVLFLGHRGPLTNIAFLYLIPVIESAGSMNRRWSIAVALMVVVGVALSTYPYLTNYIPAPPSDTFDYFNAIFRYYLVFVFASLFTMIARTTSQLGEKLGVARDRNRMAMEMHDGVQGHLVVLTKQLELLENVAESNPAKTIELSRGGRESARLAADELRYLVTRMRANALKGGFEPALRNYLDSVCGRHGISWTLELEGVEPDVPVEIEHVAFRIAQESLTNVIRHAKAKTVSLNIAYGEHSIEMSVVDDGRGFDTSVVSEGLDGLRSRAIDIGGELAIDSQAGKGTTVQVTLPYRNSKKLPA